MLLYILSVMFSVFVIEYLSVWKPIGTFTKMLKQDEMDDKEIVDMLKLFLVVFVCAVPVVNVLFVAPLIIEQINKLKGE